MSTYTVQKWFDRGYLTGVKLPSGHRRVSALSLERYLRHRTQGGSHSTKPGSRRVLVVEDEPRFRGVLKQVLENRGFEVRLATTGLQAGLAIAEFQPDCLVMDVMLEDVHGAILVRQIRAAESGRHLKIVAISGQAKRCDVEAVLAAGADAYLQKPFAAATLLRAIPALQPVLARRK